MLRLAATTGSIAVFMRLIGLCPVAAVLQQGGDCGLLRLDRGLAAGIGLRLAKTSKKQQ